jgi:hypothetical protein
MFHRAAEPRQPTTVETSMRSALILTLAGLVLAAGVALPGAEPGNHTGILGHPCLLVNAETLPVLQAKLADTRVSRFGFAPAEVWKALRAKADRLAALPTYAYSVKVPGEGGVILEDWSYTLSEQTPPPHPKSPNYPPWTAMFQERADSISTRLIHFSFAFLVTGEEHYYAKAREIALALGHWSEWTDSSYGAGRIKACLDTGHCTYSVAMFYDWCYAKLTADERVLVQQALVSKGIQPILGYVDNYPPDTNGYAVLLSGATLASLALRPEEPRAAQWLQQCLDKTRISLDRGGKDGGTFEGPMYGTYLLDSFALSFDALASARVEHGLFEHPYLATMPRYCLGLLAPDTRQIPCFSDGSPGVAVPKLMMILAQRGSTDAAFYLEQIGALKVTDLYDLVRFDGGRLDPRAPTWNPSSAFVDIGYASLRDGYNASAPTLFLKSGPTTNRIGHNHYDQNAFVISYGGQWLVPDRGYHSFYVPAKRKFSLGSIGHCTVVLDVDDAWLADTTVPSPGHDQVDLAGGRVAEFFAGNAFDYAKGEAAATYNTKDRKVLDRFDRRVLYLKPYGFVVRDELAAPEPHAFSFLLHSDGTGEFLPAGDAWRLERMHAQLHVRVLSSAPTKTAVQTYPGAESYGPFLRVETAKAPAATFTTLLVPQPYASPRYLRNGGFEKGMAGWQPRANEDLPNHRIGTDRPAEGSQCAAVDASGYYYSDRFSLPAGTRLTGKAMLRTQGTPEGKGVTMTLYFWRAGTAFAHERVGPFRHEDWQEHAVSATVPADTQEISLALEYFAPGTGFFDDVRIESDAPVAAVAEPRVTPLGAHGFDATLGPDRFVVACGAESAMHTAGDLASDGAMAVVCLDAAGAPVRAFLQGGRTLSWQGQELLRLETPGTVETLVRDGSLAATVAPDVTPHAPLPAKAALITALPSTAATLNGRPANVTRTAAGTRVSMP